MGIVLKHPAHPKRDTPEMSAAQAHDLISGNISQCEWVINRLIGDLGDMDGIDRHKLADAKKHARLMTISLMQALPPRP